MKTERLYYNSTKTLSCTAHILDIKNIDDQSYLLLDKTVFHPQGGGQPSDDGYISGVATVKVINNQEGNIEHIIPKNHDFKIGEVVELSVNEENRWKHAALHTAGHLIDICLMKSEYKNLVNMPKGNHFPNQAKITYNLVNKSAIDIDDLKEVIYQGIYQAIDDKLSIKIDNTDKIRKIQIGNYKEEGCGGTHLPNTSYLDKNSFTIRKITNKKGKLVVSYDCSNVNYKVR